MSPPKGWKHKGQIEDNRVRVTLRMRAELVERLRARARATNDSLNELIERAADQSVRRKTGGDR